MIRAIKLGIKISRQQGIRKGIQVGRHFYHWAPKARW